MREQNSGVVAKVLDNSLQVSEFELQSRYWAYYQTNTLEKGTNLFNPPPVMASHYEMILGMIQLGERLDKYQTGFGIKLNQIT